jgi:hypothetical protein
MPIRTGTRPIQTAGALGTNSFTVFQQKTANTEAAIHSNNHTPVKLVFDIKEAIAYINRKIGPFCS